MKSQRVMSAWRLLVLVLVLAFAAAACTSGDTETTGEPEDPVDEPGDDPGENPADPATDTPSDPETPVDSETPPDEAPLTASDTGVSETSIKIAYIGFDTAALVALGLISATAETVVVADAIVADLNERGGIHGRSVELVPEIWDPFAPDLQAELQRACLAVTENEEVFAAIALSFFGDAVTCLTVDHNTPMLTQSTLPGFLLYGETNNTFAVNLSEERAAASSVQILSDAGKLEGFTSFGAFGDDEPGRSDLINDVVGGALADAGLSLDTVGLVPPSIGGSGAETAALVTRFKEDGVDAVFMFGNILSDAAFMVEADKQAYNPTYLLSDFGDGTRDLIGTRAPASQLDGSIGTTWRNTGQTAAGETASPYNDSCFERFGESVIFDGEGDEGVLAAVTEQCVSFDLLEEAMLAAGRNPTRDGFVAALESIDSIEIGTGAGGSFSPDKHDAIDSVKIVEWQADCGCWFPISGYESIS